MEDIGFFKDFPLGFFLLFRLACVFYIFLFIRYVLYKVSRKV
jgi:hypothetical protein